MEETKLKNVIRFYILATQLKYKIRSGWDENHWNINKERIESIAEHCFGTCILAIGISSMAESDIDFNKVLRMLILHELGEVIIGDITPFENITPEEKMRIEHEASIKVVGDLANKEELLSLLWEFDEKKTKEAVFAHLCDKIEADIQSKFYENIGCHHSLDNQENNVVFKNAKVQKMLKEGARTPFDIWYGWDKYHYENNELFSQILDFVKNNDLKEFLE